MSIQQIRRRAGTRRDDAGVILVLTGLLLIPIMAFTALAVDMSSWYSRATELQRAADSAALSGVVWQPRNDVSATNANITLKRNGFEDGTGNISVTQGPAGADGDAYKVCVTDNKVTQYFGAVIGSPTKIERCSTAKFNLPLPMGSPNYTFGGADFVGNHTWPKPAVPAYGPAPTPPGGDYNLDPDNYNSAVVAGMTGTKAPFNGGRYGCKTVTSGTNRGYYWNASGNGRQLTSSSNNLGNYDVASYRSGGRRYYLYAIDLPDCSWTAPAQPAVAESWVIKPSMQAGYWASIEAPGTDAVQGDRFSPVCYGVRGPSNLVCPATSSAGGVNPEHPTAANENGYFYKLDIKASNPVVMIQIFDAGMESGSVASDTEWSASSSSWDTHFAVYNADGTPYNVTDNSTIASCGGGSGNVDNSGSWTLPRNSDESFIGKWRTLCTLTAPQVTANGDGYILRVWSTGVGNGANNYAIRTIAANSTAVDGTEFPITALPDSAQPSIAAWARMAINVHKDADFGSGKASFFFAKVTPKYAGQKLIMELYDVAEGAESVTVNTPGGIQQGCTYHTRPLVKNKSGTNGSGGGNLIGPGTPDDTFISGNCTISVPSSTYYNGNLMTITMSIPDDYTCDTNARPTAVDDVEFDGNGCWWSVTYKGSGSVTDNTTWAVGVGGDPVRLVPNS